MDHGVGRTLREARRKRQVDLAEIESATKIRGRFLLAIENEEWDALPGEAYEAGFIRSYAEYLGLDGARLAARHRQEVGSRPPGERLLGADPTQLAPRPARRRRPRPTPRALAVLVSAALVAVLVALGLLGDGGEPAGTPERPQRAAAANGRGEDRAASPSPVPGREQSLALHLTATDEVWVCLLDAVGEPLVDGQILLSGAEEGPFRSGSFTVSLGNGEVSMTVNGQQASIPATPSPVGYTIGRGGELRELPEGERPTCT